MSLACFFVGVGFGFVCSLRLWFEEQNVAQLSKLLARITVDPFLGNTETIGAFYASARFRFGESSDNDRQQ